MDWFEGKSPELGVPEDFLLTPRKPKNDDLKSMGMQRSRIGIIPK